MNTQIELDKIDQSLIKLQTDFNNQLNAVDNDTHDFHKAMIDLTAKYPDHKELVQFIVLVNDKIETKHSTYNDVLIDSFNDLIQVKRNLISAMSKPVETQVGFIKKLLNGTKSFADIKVIIVSITITSLVIMSFVSPDMMVSLMKALLKIIFG